MSKKNKKEKKTLIKQPKNNKRPKEKYYFGLGRRKTAIARVFLYPGKGDITVNEKKIEVPSPIYLAPLELTGNLDKFSIKTFVKGGGFNSQKGAIRLGVARALLQYEPNLKQTLRKSGFLTRDPREKERKKPGLKRARKAPQWQKR